MRSPMFGRLSGSEEILLPVKPLYMAVTLLVAMMIRPVAVTGWVLALRPDFVALVRSTGASTAAQDRFPAGISAGAGDGRCRRQPVRTTRLPTR